MHRDLVESPLLRFCITIPFIIPLYPDDNLETVIKPDVAAQRSGSYPSRSFHSKKALSENHVSHLVNAGRIS